MTIKEVPAGEIVLTEREYQDGKCALVSMQLDDLYLTIRPYIRLILMTLKVLPSFEYSLTAQTWLISIGQAENLRCFKTHVQGACYAH